VVALIGTGWIQPSTHTLAASSNISVFLPAANLREGPLDMETPAEDSDQGDPLGERTPLGHRQEKEPAHEAGHPVGTGQDGEVAGWINRAERCLSGNPSAADRMNAYASYRFAARRGSTLAEQKLEQLAKTMSGTELRLGRIDCGGCRAVMMKEEGLTGNGAENEPLKLQGIVWEGPERLALISGRAFVEGESGFIKDGKIRLRWPVKCLAIEPGLVRVELKDRKIELRLPPDPLEPRVANPP